jgi:tRNA(Ile)-lysidine synthase
MPRSKKCSVPAATEPGPVSPVEAGRLFSSVEQCRCLLLAVSGGSDSMALMVLADRWARETGWPGRLHVAVVDHGLRPEAADEAAFVEREAKRLGLKAHVLNWSGPYPKTGIPAAAREARYGLLCGLARTLDAAVLTAHTQDDQAETVVMRLARGSGVDGLSAMETGTVRDGVTLVRPLLPVSRQRLRDTLRQAGMTWIDDPTNENMTHERVRVRKALDVLDGLGVSREAVALTAARLGRARSALEVAQAGLMQVAVRIKANSYAEIDLECWVHGPAELQVRVIMTLASMFGGGQEISLSGAERVRDWTLAGQGRATTFAGCRFARRKREIVVGREAARIGCHGERLSGVIVWDNRYEIAVPAGLLPATVVPARDCKGLARPRDIPDFVWQGLPVVCCERGHFTPPGAAHGGEAGDKQPVFRLIHAPLRAHHAR